MVGKRDRRRIIVRLTFLNKKVVLLILLSILVTNVITYSCIKNTLDIYDDDVNTYKVMFNNTYSNSTDKYMLKPRIDNPYNDELKNKINISLIEAFVDWMPEKLRYAELSFLGVEICTDKYLSVHMVYTFYGRRVDHVNICNTVDMQTGEIVYLDNLIEVNEEFVKRLLADGILKVDYDWMSDKYDVDYPGLETEDIGSVLEKLKLCSEPFNQDNWVFKPTFYLEANRLYLLNIFNPGSAGYIELDKIESELKVEKW